MSVVTGTEGYPVLPPGWTPSMVNSVLASALTASALALLSTKVINNQVVEAASLQALVELIYIRMGNDTVFSALNSLDNTLSAASSASQALTTIQNLHNQVGVTGSSVFPFPTTGFNNESLGPPGLVISAKRFTYSANGVAMSTFYSMPTPQDGVTITNLQYRGYHTFNIQTTNSYMSAYRGLGSAFFRIIPPTFQVTVPPNGGMSGYTSTILSSGQPAYQYFVGQLNTARDNLSTYIGVLSGQSSQSGVKSFISSLRKVLTAMPPAGASFSTVKNWVLDGNQYDNTPQ